MKFVVLQEGETAAALAARVFGAKTKAAKAAAEAAILHANPMLRDPANLKAGVLVGVPDTAAAAAAGGGDVASVASQLIQAAHDIVGDLNAVISPGLDDQEKEVRVTLEALKAPELAKVAERIPELKQLLPAAAKRAEQQLAQVGSIRAHQKDALAEFDRDIAELRKSFE